MPGRHQEPDPRALRRIGNRLGMATMVCFACGHEALPAHGNGHCPVCRAVLTWRFPLTR